MQAGLMMLANPMVLIITAIVVAVGLLAYAVYANWDKIKAAWAGISAAFQAGVQRVKGWLSGMPAWMQSIGSAMMQGLLSAISPLGLAHKLISVAKTGIAAFRNYLGIKSPSRLFMEMGGHMTGGLALGIERGGRQATRGMGRMAAGMAGAGAMAMAPAASAAPIATPGAHVSEKIEIHIHQRAGEDAEGLAKRVAELIEQNRHSARRRSYADDF